MRYVLAALVAAISLKRASPAPRPSSRAMPGNLKIGIVALSAGYFNPIIIKIQ
jgi:hypothetical protein